MFNMKTLHRIAVTLVTCFTVVYLRAAAGVEPGAADRAEVGSQQAIAAQPDLLYLSNRSVTRHQLILGAEKLAYAATAASLDVRNEKAEPVGRVFYISYTADKPSGAGRPLTFVFNGGRGGVGLSAHGGPGAQARCLRQRWKGVADAGVPCG